MDPVTRKLILIGFGIIMLVILINVCSDIFLVIAIMSLMTNLLVFAELGHKFIDSGEEKPVNEPTNEPILVPEAIEKPAQVEQLPTDTYSDSYIPSRNTGHISSYYEAPLLEPDEMFPRYYGDADNEAVAYQLRRIRAKQSIDGYVNKSVDHYKAYLRSEPADSENRDWWGNRDI